MSTMVTMSGPRTRSVALAMLLLAFSPPALATPTTPSEPPPMANTAAPPVEPLASPVEIGTVPETPATPATELLPPPAAETTAPVPSYVPTPAREPNPPIFERWWFWTAIAAFAVTAVVIVATSSGPNTPKTDLGNQPAF
jgi:hypothetical protein